MMVLPAHAVDTARAAAKRCKKLKRIIGELFDVNLVEAWLLQELFQQAMGRI
jgi:hypothetical protein